MLSKEAAEAHTKGCWHALNLLGPIWKENVAAAISTRQSIAA